MSQFDKINEVLGCLQQVAHQLVEHGDSQAIRDLYLTLHETFDHFAAHAEQRQKQAETTVEEKDELAFDLDGDDEDVVAQQPTPTTTTTTTTKVESKVQAPIVPKQQEKEKTPQQLHKEQLEQEKQLKLKEERLQQLKQFKEIELYIGDKFTQYGCSFEQDLFTPNDPLKIGLVHIQAFLLILRKLGVYLTKQEITLLLTKFKPTHAQIEDYTNTHIVHESNLPIEKNYVNYSLLFQYLQALNNMSLTTRAAIVSNVPALMSSRALDYKPSNPHPLDDLKENAKISGLVMKENDHTNQIAAFNEPMAPIVLLTEHANQPKEYVINMSEVQKLIKEFQSIHPSPSRLYASIKRSAPSTINVTQYGENTVSIEALLAGLKTFHFKLSQLPCTIDVFKQYIGLYSEKCLPAITFAEFICFLQCEEPKRGWNALLSQSSSTTSSTQQQPQSTIAPKVSTGPINTKSQEFIDIITAIMKSRDFSQAMITISSADVRQVFRQLSRGELFVTVDDIITHLIDARCTVQLIQNEQFKTFVTLYSTTRNNKLNYNDFINFRDCRTNYMDVVQDTMTQVTIIQDDAPLYNSFQLIQQHFITNQHLSFHYAAQPILNGNTTIMSQVQFYYTLLSTSISISYDQCVFLYQQLNAQMPQGTQPIEETITIQSIQSQPKQEDEDETITVPLVYLPYQVMNAIVHEPLLYPLIAKAYTTETGQPIPMKQTKRGANSNVTALSDDNDLTLLMNSLCIDEKTLQEQQPKPSQRFQSTLISDMTNETNNFVSTDFQRGTRQHFQDHIQKRKQLRTSIGLGTNEVKKVPDNCILTENAEIIPYSQYTAPIHNNASKLHIDFDNDHGGKTPIKSRENYYPHAKQTYNLATATEDEHPHQHRSKINRRSNIFTDEQDDELTTELTQRGKNTRQFHSSVLKLRQTPLRGHVRQGMAPTSKLLLGVQPTVSYTPLKPLSGAALRTYPNRNQTAIQFESPQQDNNNDKVPTKYHRAPYNPETSRQAIGHLGDGFQPADTPFLIRRQAKFSKLTQQEQVLAEEKLSQMINPKDVSRRRTGYTNPNSVSELMNYDSVHPIIKTDVKLVNDIDNAVLNDTDVEQYIIDNTNNLYKNIALRQLINVKQEQKQSPPQQQQVDDVSRFELEMGIEPLKTENNNTINERIIDEQQQGDENGMVFTLDDDEQQQPSSTMNDDIINESQQIDEPQPIIDDGKLTPEQLHTLNCTLTRTSFRIGKAKEVFGKWSNYSGSITAQHIATALNSHNCTITVDEAQQLIDTVALEPGTGLNLSGYMRLLGRGSD